METLSAVPRELQLCRVPDSAGDTGYGSSSQPMPPQVSPAGREQTLKERASVLLPLSPADVGMGEPQCCSWPVNGVVVWEARLSWGQQQQCIGSSCHCLLLSSGEHQRSWGGREGARSWKEETTCIPCPWLIPASSTAVPQLTARTGHEQLWVSPCPSRSFGDNSSFAGRWWGTGPPLHVPVPCPTPPCCPPLLQGLQPHLTLKPQRLRVSVQHLPLVPLDLPMGIS